MKIDHYNYGLSWGSFSELEMIVVRSNRKVEIYTIYYIYIYKSILYILYTIRLSLKKNFTKIFNLFSHRLGGGWDDILFLATSVLISQVCIIFLIYEGVNVPKVTCIQNKYWHPSNLPLNLSQGSVL